MTKTSLNTSCSKLKRKGLVAAWRLPYAIDADLEGFRSSAVKLNLILLQVVYFYSTTTVHSEHSIVLSSTLQPTQ